MNENQLPNLVVPPPVVDPLHTTAFELRDQSIFLHKIKNRILTDCHIDAEVVAAAESDLLKRTIKFGEQIAAPAWFIPAMTALLVPINQRLDQMEARLNNRFTVALENCQRRVFNSHATCETSILRALRCERVDNPNCNQVPPAGRFPATLGEALVITQHAPFQWLSDFYGEIFDGETVAERRRNFLEFIGTPRI